MPRESFLVVSRSGGVTYALKLNMTIKKRLRSCELSRKFSRMFHAQNESNKWWKFRTQYYPNSNATRGCVSLNRLHAYSSTLSVKRPELVLILFFLYNFHFFNTHFMAIKSSGALIETIDEF